VQRSNWVLGGLSALAGRTRGVTTLAASRIQLSRIHRPVLDKYTFPVALLNVETGTFGQVNYGYLVAGAVIAMVPCVILYLTLQRYHVQGLTSGAVQG
jgi:ABC-type maltose transport system permease subunit